MYICPLMYTYIYMPSITTITNLLIMPNKQEFEFTQQRNMGSTVQKIYELCQVMSHHVMLG